MGSAQSMPLDMYPTEVFCACLPSARPASFQITAHPLRKALELHCEPRPWTGWTPLATCGAPQTPNILSNGAEFGCLKDINSLRKTDLPLLPQSAAGAPSPFPKYFRGRESGPLTYVLSSLPYRAIGNRSHVPLLRADTIRRNIIYDRFIGSLRPSPSVGPTPRVSPPSPTSGDPTCLPSKIVQFCWPMGLASFALAHSPADGANRTIDCRMRSV